MAAGITQPGGAGTTIFFQTDTSAPDGVAYHEADFATAFPTDFVDLGTTPKSYRCKVDIQNGDGALTATTTWQGTRSTVIFDAGKTYKLHTTGISNRWTKWGTLTTGADGSPVGVDGLNVYFGAPPTQVGSLPQQGLSGNCALYGCYLANMQAVAASSRIFVAPGFTPNSSDVIDVTVFTAAGIQGFGSNFGEINRMRRVSASGLGSGLNGHIVQWNCTDADEITIFFPNGDRKVSTAGYVRIGNPHFIGSSTSADTHCTVAGIFLNPIWSQATIQADSPIVLEHWISFGVIVTDSSGNPISGVPVEVWDPFNSRFVFSAPVTTSANGTIDFLCLQSTAEFGFGTSPLAPFRNALMVYGHENDGIMHDHGPFTIYLNRGAQNQLVQKFNFPYTTYLTSQRQYSALYLNLQIPSPNAGVPTNWQEVTV